MHGFKTKDLLEKHNKNCTTEPTRIILPEEKEKFMKFKNYAHQLKVPFVIYADFESLTVPINSASNNDNKSKTEAYQHHTPCGFAYKVVCCEDQYTKLIELYRGKTCVEKFLDCMMQEKNIFLKLLIKIKIIKRSQNKIKKIIKMQECAISVKKIYMIKFGNIVILLVNIVELHMIIVIKNMLFLNIFQLYFII